MIKIFLHVVVAAMMVVPAVAQHSDQDDQDDNGVVESQTGHYGDPVSTSVAPITLAQAIKDRVVNKPCIVRAKVVDVCSAKGCWLMLKDGDSEVRVSFKDYGFFVPSSLKGRMVLVQGVLSEEVTSEADRRHYAEDAGMSDEEINMIKGPLQEYAFEATGVKGE